MRTSEKAPQLTQLLQALAPGHILPHDPHSVSVVAKNKKKTKNQNNTVFSNYHTTGLFCVQFQTQMIDETFVL